MDIEWILASFGIFLFVFTLATLFLVRKREARIAAENGDRPEYDDGSAISDWTKACQKSLDWSRARRNSKGVSK